MSILLLLLSCCSRDNCQILSFFLKNSSLLKSPGLVISSKPGIGFTILSLMNFPGIPLFGESFIFGTLILFLILLLLCLVLGIVSTISLLRSSLSVSQLLCKFISGNTHASIPTSLTKGSSSFISPVSNLRFMPMVL